MNGKGSKRRKESYSKVTDNLGKIDWSKREPSQVRSEQGGNADDGGRSPSSTAGAQKQ